MPNARSPVCWNGVLGIWSEFSRVVVPLQHALALSHWLCHGPPAWGVQRQFVDAVKSVPPGWSSTSPKQRYENGDQVNPEERAVSPWSRPCGAGNVANVNGAGATRW